jgi:hypothetical protein
VDLDARQRRWLYAPIFKLLRNQKAHTSIKNQGKVSSLKVNFETECGVKRQLCLQIVQYDRF